MIQFLNALQGVANPFVYTVFGLLFAAWLVFQFRGHAWSKLDRESYLLAGTVASTLTCVYIAALLAVAA